MIKNFLISLLLFAQPSQCEKETEYYDDSFEKELYPYATRGLKESYRSSVVIFSTDGESIIGSGSGNYFKYKDKRFIITAAHVVDESKEIFVGEKSVDIHPAKIEYINREVDIAIISIKSYLKGTKPVDFKASKRSYIGEDIYHTGHPDGESWHVSQGLVSKIGLDYFILNTFAWPGSSGSVVFNKAGRVVGVVSAIKISNPLGLPDMVEHIVIVSNINSIKIEEIISEIQWS